MRCFVVLLFVVAGCGQPMPSDPPPLAAANTHEFVASRARDAAGKAAVDCGTAPSSISTELAHRCAIALLDSGIPFFVVFTEYQREFDVGAPFALVGTASQDLHVITGGAITRCATPHIQQTEDRAERLLCLKADQKNRIVLATGSVAPPRRVDGRFPPGGVTVELVVSEKGTVESVRPLMKAVESLTSDERARLKEAKDSLRFTPARLFGRPVRCVYHTVLD